MPTEIMNARLADLLAEPREDLDVEVKNWLDLKCNNEDKATFAKAALALANHGGGYILLGLKDNPEGIVESTDRPASMEQYGQDYINSIIQSYCEPQFHCSVSFVRNPLGLLFPIIKIPGGHKVPVLAKRGGPEGKIVRKNAVYMRKSGPRSEEPQRFQEWDELLARCFSNRRDEMLDHLRRTLTGPSSQMEPPSDDERLIRWTDDSYNRWDDLTTNLDHSSGPRFPHGHFQLAYEIQGNVRQISPARFPDVLQKSVVRHSGWPPFIYIVRDGITPYQFDSAIECWIGGDTKTPLESRDCARSDFWRISPDGYGYLLRGFQEDGTDVLRAGHKDVTAGTMFDITLPVWRVGESLLHAVSLASNLFDGPTSIKFNVRYTGLENRSLTSIGSDRYVSPGRVSRQSAISLKTHVESELVAPNLPEIVHDLLLPLYALFDFFELPMQLVVKELARMRDGRIS